MRTTLRREDYLDRPKRPFSEAFPALRFEPQSEFLIESETFIRLMREFFGFKITRRNLQLYHSPFLQLLPPPIHVGGHKSYYLNPEHTWRLAVILHLNTRHFMPLKAIRELLKKYPERHYDIIMKDILTLKELDQVVAHFGEGFEVKDYLFHKVSQVLGALDDSDEPEALQDAATRDKILRRFTHEYERWLDSNQRRRVEAFLHERKPD